MKIKALLIRAKVWSKPALAWMLIGMVAACSSTHDNVEIAGAEPDSDATAIGALDIANFSSDAFNADPTIEECVLSGGTTTSCYRLTIAGEPTETAVGPFCPESISSTAEEGGLWFDGSGIVHDVDGDFIVGLPEIYDDSTWAMYDPATGLVNVTDGVEGCEVAGNPNGDPDVVNNCLECTLDSLGGGIERTVLIPTTPVPAQATESDRHSNIGVALNGVLLGPPAPIDLILSSYTLGVFDDCGGHVNPHEGYHYHASTGCSETGVQQDGHAPLLGYALDGYGIYATLDVDGKASTDLDECRGETDDIRGYHYHSAAAGENEFISCFHGETGSVVDDERPAGAQRGPGGQNRPQGGGNGGPPEEAFTACANLQTDDACSVETPEGTLGGQCVAEPRDERLVCMPAR